MAKCVFGSTGNLAKSLLLIVFALTTPANSQTTPPASEPAEQVEAKDTANEPAPIELSPFARQLKAVLSTSLLAVQGEANAERFEGIAANYQQNDFQSIWLENQKPTQKARNALDILRNAADHGLDPNEYNVEALFQKLGARNADTLVDLEVQLTRSVVAYAQHLNAGRLNPQAVNREIVVFPEAVSSNKILQNLRSTKHIQVYLRLFAPHTPRYERLRNALSEYKVIAANGGWTQIGDGEALKPGMSDARVPALRARMIEDGSLDKSLAEGETYDDGVVAAVKKFQLRLGLEPDGVIGTQSLEQLNVPAAKRIRTMELNLERRRWMQNNYGRYYIFANLADQNIKLVRDEKTLLHELIQVGQPYHRTPVFSDVMNHIILNPYWNVPYSIATKEYLPKLKLNPGALVSQNIRVLKGGKVISPYSVPWTSLSRKHFPVRLRQDSGPKNALGRVKFMFPNKFNVYIHDTPSKSKFSKASRYFSHGCLRLQDPLSLAELILGQQGWSRKKIDGVVRSGKRTVVKLDNKIPVHVTYLTSWVNKDGSVHFRRDIYGRDKILDLAMLKANTR